MKNSDNSTNGTYSWSPCDDLVQQNETLSYGVIILNTPINSVNPDVVLNLWNQAKIRVTVDGGTEKWMQWLKMNGRELNSIFYPDLITGDMDSLSNDVLQLLTGDNTKVIVTPDQNETDFVKSLKEVKEYCVTKNLEIEVVYALADTCGRFDQIMANINALYKAKHVLKGVTIFQVASSSLSWILDKGTHSIQIPSNLRENQDWCALLPIGSPCKVTTTGLKWNVDNVILEFGGLVSSSNTYDGSSVVTITTDNPIIWSMSTESLLA